jgi:hypothetical protein
MRDGSDSGAGGTSSSAGRLLEFLRALAQEVEIGVNPARKGRGEISLAVT